MFPDTIINLLIQIPLVGIFVWSSIETGRRQDARDQKRDEAYASERKERDNAWRDFLSDQREQNNTAISRIAEEVKGNSQEIARMNAILSAHDAASKERSVTTRLNNK